MATSSHSNAEVTGFFSLPPELRLAIYGLTITKPDCMNIENSEAKINGSIILPAVMRISKTMREDAVELCQKHLLDARSVLVAREIAKLVVIESVTQHWQEVFSVGMADCYRAKSHQPIRNGRQWMVRIDEVVAKLERSV
ncbi:hypothetical protein LTR56_002591 [Elasticomyces elasticus]|nr:hypothetical protein LTR22_013493 [Elasticomyces elasticus]KAK3657077.1 hypothetical protein LTR56_002591 [Elasticomyces elasticus]KAK4926694.1 hypothetical protein LTR49_006376 [Elasticomyces elasticus]KAK5762355.1 hypothetical protein LTS12_007514 [Elasticomyces elasticus]